MQLDKAKEDIMKVDLLYQHFNIMFLVGILVAVSGCGGYAVGKSLHMASVDGKETSYKLLKPSLPTPE